MYGSPGFGVVDAPPRGPYHPGMPPTSPHSPEAGPVLLAHLVAAPLPGVGDHRTEDATGFPAGGICTFEEITRPELHPDHGPLIALEYEAAEPLATHRLCELAKSIADRHELHRIEITHAIGAVPLGMPSVRIITAADLESAFISIHGLNIQGMPTQDISLS